MADQVLSLFVGKLVDYVAVPVGRHFSYLFRYHGNLEEFRNQLRDLEMAGKDVKQLAEAAERKGEVILPSVEDWLKRVDASSDEAKRFVGEEDAISKCCFKGPLNLKVRYQRSRKAKKKASELDAIRKDGTFNSISAPAPPLQIGSLNNENEFDFESRRSIFNEIVEAIKDDGVGMIGIWGMAGIGKTTLVKRAAKYAKDEALFEEVAMAVVSQNPSVKAIQGQIADTIGLNFTRESEGGRAGQLLQRLLARKKILVILDDIWESIELNDIGIPCGSQHKSCKVILTSRIQGVCEEMRTEKKFKIDLLRPNEALCLFLQMSGVDDRFSEKGRLAEKLTEECGRLPVSIVIVARGLLNKRKVSWEDMLNRLQNSDPDTKVRASIELSYQNLYREEEKMFFLLCALFPEDYEIPVEVLFQYGVGLNLFERVDNMDEAVVRAHNLALRLKSQCLLLDEGDEDFVKMHDVVRDVALAIASEGKHAFLLQSVAQCTEWPGKTAISLWSDDVKKLPDALECPQLQILMLNCNQDLQLHDNFYASMKNLVVLDISYMEFLQLPQSFAGLENLRTLRLSSCKLGDVSTIGRLRNLVCLGFYGLDIRVLPEEVGELSNLRLLDFSSCRSLEVIKPGVIQNLSQLEVLGVGRNVQWCKGKEACSHENASLSELIHLSRLMTLEICIPNASMLRDDVLFENLTKFKISIGSYDFSRSAMLSSSTQILQLKRLSKNAVLRSGIKMLMKKAQHLELEFISGIFVALSSHFGGYGSLKELIVNCCLDVNYVLDVSESEYEPETSSLEQLHLSNLPLLKEIIKGGSKCAKYSAFAKLIVMRMESCDKLEYVFDHISSSESLSKLRKLQVEKCRNLQAICGSKEEDDVIVFPQLSHLKLSNLKSLTSFGSKFAMESTLFDKKVTFLALETLDINNLETLEKIWHIHTPVESFFQLKILKLTQCRKLLVVFPPQATSVLRNLEQIRIEKCHKLETLFQSDEMVLFPRLLTLELVNLPKLTSIVSNASQNISQATVIFSASKIMTPHKLHNLEPIMDQQLLTFFPKLKKLQLEGIGCLSSTAHPLHMIKGLEPLEELIIKDNSVNILPQGIATLHKLTKLQLGFIHEPIECFESLNRHGGFQNLTLLNFFSCNGVKSLLRPSAFSCLVQLKELFVCECETIESIVGETSTEQNFDKAIEFSKLWNLKLLNLPCLASFYNGQCGLKFPCLRGFSIKNCPKLKNFASMSRETLEPSGQNLESEDALFGQQVSFGSRLICLGLEQLGLIEDIWHSGHPTTIVGELSRLSVEGCNRLLKLFPSNLIVGLHNLSWLEVRSCRSLEHVIAVEDHPPLLSNLTTLELYDLPELKQLWWNKNSCESFGLSNLLTLTIKFCPALQFIFDPSVADRLEYLTSLVVEDCSSMVEIVAEEPGKKIEFPLLKNLYLKNLPCFKVNQNVEFPRVEYVSVDRCFRTFESCFVNVRSQPAGSVRFFESFCGESSKTGLTL